MWTGGVNFIYLWITKKNLALCWHQHHVRAAFKPIHGQLHEGWRLKRVEG